MQTPKAQPSQGGLRRQLVVFLGVWIALGSLAAVLQVVGGAYESDFGSHPDEASHFVTGLMVRDYLAGGIPEHPMRYAERYYDHFPKVAIGHYPPGFYVIEGLWLLVFPVARWSVLVFMAAQSGLLGALAYSLTARRAGVGIALGAGALAVALPITQILTAAVMSDLLLSLACLAAVMAFSRFMERGRWKDSLMFGMWAAAAAMVKGSGLLLALFVPFAIAMAGRWDLLKRPALWMGALPVVLIAGPWYLYTTAITAEGMVEKNLVTHLSEVFPYFASQWVQWMGWTVSVLVVYALASAWRRKQFRADVLFVCFVAFAAALVVFYALTPAGLDPRYLMPLVAPVLVLAGCGVREIGGWIKGRRGWVPVVALLGLAGAEMVRIERKESRGWEEIAWRIVGESGDAVPEVLVVSDARGEGALIAELAMRDPDRPSFTAHRGSKVLSSSGWLGQDYESAFATGAELDQFLTERRIPWVVIDRSIPDHARLPYHDQIELLLEGEHRSPLAKESQMSIVRQRGVRGSASLYRSPK